MAQKTQRNIVSPVTTAPISEGEDLAKRISARLTAQRVRFQAKRMMGGICFMVADKMCLGTAKHRLMVRFDPTLHEDVIARPGAGPMDFTGRPLRGYVFVQPAALRDDRVLASWIDLALAYNPRARRSKKAAKASPQKRVR